MAGYLAPLRRELIGMARGRVLEVGVGDGPNFPLYDPKLVASVDAIEPDGARLRKARARAAGAPMPIHLLQASVEDLPFEDGAFDCVVATLAFCSVGDPLRGLREVRRVLRQDGTLLALEHVRARGAIAAALQDLVTPITRLVDGNCHWNRDTERTMREAGFTIARRREITWFRIPIILLQAVK